MVSMRLSLELIDKRLRMSNLDQHFENQYLITLFNQQVPREVQFLMSCAIDFSPPWSKCFAKKCSGVRRSDHISSMTCLDLLRMSQQHWKCRWTVNTRDDFLSADQCGCVDEVLLTLVNGDVGWGREVSIKPASDTLQVQPQLQRAFGSGSTIKLSPLLYAVTSNALTWCCVG